MGKSRPLARFAVLQLALRDGNIPGGLVAFRCIAADSALHRVEDRAGTVMVSGERAQARGGALYADIRGALRVEHQANRSPR